MATLGQARLAKLDALPSGSFVIDDVNEAMRYWYLSGIPTVILNALNGSQSSDIYDLPGRNSFIVDNRTAVIVNVQGSLDGTSFVNICSTTATATIQTFNVVAASAFRYYRLTSASNATANFSAVRN